MVLLASAYDQSRYFKAADLQEEKKLRIKSVTEESIGVGAEKEQKVVVWFTNQPRQQPHHPWCLRRRRRRLDRPDHRAVSNDG